jgi:hypothetical protein
MNRATSVRHFGYLRLRSGANIQRLPAVQAQGSRSPSSSPEVKKAALLGRLSMPCILMVLQKISKPP